MTKPVVNFINTPRFYNWQGKEEHPVAEVYALDHPLLGQGKVYTSQIVQKFDDGSFETLNTIYKPYKNEI